MADLLNLALSSTGRSGMNLWCTPCGTVHELDLPDVERIVYALAAAVRGAYKAGFEDGGDEFGEGWRDHVPAAVCLRAELASTLHLGGTAEAVANREQAGPAPAPTAARPAAGCDGCGRLVPDPARRCDDCQREFEQWRDDGAGAPVTVVGPGPATLPPGPVLPVETRVLYPTRHTRFEQAISETGQRIAEGAELDAERAGRPCPHDTIRYEDHDGILRCAGCRERMAGR